MQLLREAKQRFASEFKPRISELGHSFVYKLMEVNGSVVIDVRIGFKNGLDIFFGKRIPENKRREIEQILPKEYEYKEHTIPVQLSYLPS